MPASPQTTLKFRYKHKGLYFDAFGDDFSVRDDFPRYFLVYLAELKPYPQEQPDCPQVSVSGGAWKLEVTDSATGQTGTLESWTLNLRGKPSSTDDEYYYTDEFGIAPGAARGTLNDTNGGRDTINAAAVSTNSTINLNNGSTSTIAGRNLIVNGGIEWAYGGDGNDSITGNSLSNYLVGGRGNDVINGGDGSDMLDGGRGNDSITGGEGMNLYVVQKETGAIKTITDFSSLNAEKIILVTGTIKWLKMEP